MPTYDYDCTACGIAFEHFQSITSPPLETCPECGGKVERKINGGIGLIFKGSGFYLTDYKNSSKKDGDGKSKKEEKSSTEKKTDSKKEASSAKAEE